MDTTSKEQFDRLQFDFNELKFKFDALVRQINSSKKTTFFFNNTADPAFTVEGAVAVVGGKLKIYTGGAWVVVGTQS
jgi:hypothetical protein